jgi:glutamine synthetase
MLGANDSIACANIMLNTIVSDTLDRYADTLEGVSPEEFNSAVTALIRSEYKAHKRVIFNGNGYSHEWELEAMARGLHNYKTTVDAVPHYTDEKNVALFERKGIFTATEIASRRDILLENYSSMLAIEAAAMVDIARKFIVPASLSYIGELTKILADKKASGIKACRTERALVDKLSDYTDLAYGYACELSDALAAADGYEHGIERAKYLADTVKPCMEKLRAAADELEPLTAKKYWPYPSYSDLLFGV